jgi:hypothetical protein
MQARLTFLGQVAWNYKSYIGWNANVQGCPERSGWTLFFRPDYALNETCFMGQVEWLQAPKHEGLASGTKFSYIIPGTNQVIAVGEVL